MSENCSGNCSECSSDCAEREIQKEKPHKLSKIKKVYGIVSGKGGVGKSLITSILSVGMSRKGKKVGIMDADITGPSIPKAFGLIDKAEGTEEGILPVSSETGIKIMSVNLLLDDVTSPVVWRGPVIAGVIKQFWQEVIWGELDIMFIDMPPGTSDVPLTVFQTVPLDGIIIVTSPQELVSMIVTKAVKMAEMMKIPIVGIVENMSYFKSDDGKIHMIFGESRLEEFAGDNKLNIIGRIPIDPKIAEACDKGNMEGYNGEVINDISDNFLKLIQK